MEKKCIFCGCDCQVIALCWECSDRMNGADEEEEEVEE